MESRSSATIGKEAIFQLSDKYQTSNIRRVTWADMRFFIESFPNARPVRFPAVIVLQKTGYAGSPWQVIIFQKHTFYVV